MVLPWTNGSLWPRRKLRNSELNQATLQLSPCLQDGTYGQHPLVKDSPQSGYTLT